MKALVVLTTTDSEDVAENISKKLVEERLAACIQIIPMKSRYWWQGRVEEASEYLLIIKTTDKKYPELERRIKELHNYTVPEILAIPVVRGYKPYLDWLSNEIGEEGG